MQDILNMLPVWVQIALALVGAASMIAALTPTPKDDEVLKTVRKVLDLIAFNFGGAKNADPEKKK